MRKRFVVVNLVLGMVTATTVRAQTAVEYSNVLDERAIAGGGAHAALDPQQVLYTVAPDPVGAPNPRDVVDFSAVVGPPCTGDPDYEVDALANCRDAYFHQVRRNTANLLISFGGDPAGDAVWVETPTGANGVVWTQANLSNPNPAGDVEDVDGLELWGPWGGVGSNVFSHTGEPTNFSALTSLPSGPYSVPLVTIVAAVRALGYTGSDSAVDLDGLMFRRARASWYGIWGPGAWIMFSIRSTTAAGGSFDGGEIIVMRYGGAPVFLSHGGHLWNTAFNVSAAFGVPTEEVDALEAGPQALNMLVLLDRSGSMVDFVRATGNTRCADALTTAIADVNAFFTANPMGSVAVWTFADDGPTNRTGGFVGSAAALAALNALSPEGCDGSTPLAEAICEAADALAALPGTAPASKILAISSDGGENNSGGDCAGADSTIFPPPAGNYSPGSWQDNVWTKLEGSAVVLTRFWTALSLDGITHDTETGLLLGGGGDDVFFQDIARNGGYIEMIDDDDTVLPEITGACCTEGEACLEVSVFMCESLGGEFLGEETDCADGEAVCFLEPTDHAMFDVEPDGDVDKADFAAFLIAFTGPLP